MHDSVLMIVIILMDVNIKGEYKKMIKMMQVVILNADDGDFSVSLETSPTLVTAQRHRCNAFRTNSTS